ncbi:hypothetical protein [Lacipirellula sp.]|uniref:hypothetical protein n=1 Tax=Lacipirellula sp. TaxID=2691419 RepID=UPI003D12B46F
MRQPFITLAPFGAKAIVNQITGEHVPYDGTMNSRQLVETNILTSQVALQASLIDGGFLLPANADLLVELQKAYQASIA